MRVDDPLARANCLPDGSQLAVGIVVSRFNSAITGLLLKGAREALSDCRVPEENTSTLFVPGALEIPVVAKGLINRGGIDAVVALGCVIQGETSHYEIVARGSATGIARVAEETGVPVTNGILATMNLSQARARAGGAKGNVGRDAALAAVETAILIHRLAQDRE